MNTMDGKMLREGSGIYRNQLITIEDLESFKTGLLNKIRTILQIGNIDELFSAAAFNYAANHLQG